MLLGNESYWKISRYLFLIGDWKPAVKFLTYAIRGKKNPNTRN
ncbi:hypothetical protein FHT76_000176 [Rhizobium sp. BK176]|nr:hypothetical protein [Rhizobium sp. BK176]